MSKKLFTGTTNGLELWVDERALDWLKQEHANRLKGRLERAGGKYRGGPIGDTPEIHIPRILNRIKITESCWLWTGALAHGYGSIRINQRHWMMQALIYFLIHFEKPEEVCHHCDNPPCCRPEHLFGGTHKENMEDASRKGLMPRGEAQGCSKLKQWQVEAMRRDYVPGQTHCNYRVLAERFGVSSSQAQRIVKRQRWAHI